MYPRERHGSADPQSSFESGSLFACLAVEKAKTKTNISVAPMPGQQHRQHWPSVAGAASVMDITYLLTFVSVIPN
jgi:hypothetical protein